MTLKCRPSGPQHQQVWLTVAIVILCTQLQVAVMTRKGTQQAQPKAQWNPIEINSFLTYLISVKSAMAGTSFKKVTYNEAAKSIESLRTVGPVKTGAHCMNKWGMLKQIYNAIESYRHHKSGCHWDNECGANIEGPATEAVWEEYVSRKPNFPMKSFKTAAGHTIPRWKKFCPITALHEVLLPITPPHYHQTNHPQLPVLAAHPMALTTHQFIPLIPSMAQPKISWGVPPPPNPAFEDYGSSTMAAPPTMSSCTSTSALSAPTMSAPYKSLPAMFAPMSAPMSAPPMSAPMSAPPMSAPMSAPAKSAPMSSGSSAGKCSHAEMTHGHSAPPSTTYTSVSQLTRPESEKKPRLSTTSGKTCPSASKKTTVQDTANTTVLMNLQGTINRLSDSLNTSFSASEETRVADIRTRAFKGGQGGFHQHIHE
ncbi:hypothetical protein EDB19DRAFT_1917172 [Suillus lakei]|nr:hypothetical protein EDB19DRAFT_1917172 [Suillus lakei]